MADRAQGGPTQLANAFRDWIGRGVELIGLLIEQEVIVPKVGPETCQWKFLVFKYNAKKSASSALSAPAMSRAAFSPRRFGVWSLAPRRAAIAFSFIALIS